MTLSRVESGGSLLHAVLNLLSVGSGRRADIAMKNKVES
jgi:hypothetical protein